jgi:6-methylsalicylate decarboxylase
MRQTNILVAISRRSFLVASSGASLLLGQGPSRPRRIDVHHHFGSPGFIAALREIDARPVKGYPSWTALGTWKDYSPARTIEAMDAGQTETAVVSCTAPGIWFGDSTQTRRLAREMNDWATANMVRAYKGRFGLFGVLPLPDLDASLREIEYVLDTLKADGVGLLTSYDNRYPGDPYFAPLFEELNRRGAVVYFHPVDAPCCQGLIPDVGVGTVEYNTDTARAIVSLLASNSPAQYAATRYPRIRFIFSHGGGTMPSLIERIGVGAPDDIADKLLAVPEPNSKLFHLRRFFYDTAQSTNPVQMQGLKIVAGTSQIVFGTDYPFGAGLARHAAGLQKCGFSQSELLGIDRENVLRILPQYKS